LGRADVDGGATAATAAATASSGAARAAAAAGAGGARQVVVAVAPDGDAEVVAVAVRGGGQGAAGAADVCVPAVLQALATAEVDGDNPVAGAADREVHIEPVRPRLAGADVDGAATAATATAAATAAAATTAATAAGADRDVGVTAALETLGGHDLVVMVTQVHTSVRPRGEVVADGDGAAGPPLLPDAPVLLEGRGADDGGGVGTGRLVDVVRTTVGSDRAPERPGRPERAPVVDDVVLHQR